MTRSIIVGCKSALRNENDDLISAWWLAACWYHQRCWKWPSSTVCSLQVFRVVSVCLGCPPETICWEYRDKDKNFHRLGPLTPLDFYREHVKPLYNIEDKVRSHCSFTLGHWAGSGPCRSSSLICYIPFQTFSCFNRSALWMTPDPRIRTGSCTPLSFLVTWLGPAAHCTTISPSSCWRRLQATPSSRAR